MDLTKFKLGVGPMSHEIVDLCLEYSKIYDYPIMIIASRNQVDFDSGYAFNTADLVSYVKQNKNYDATRVLICRDHCGPYFADVDKNLSLVEAVDRCLATIRSDIEAGFDLLHIDVSRVLDREQDNIAMQLFKHALNLRPSIIFEFGSEDNTGEQLDLSLARLERQLTFANAYQSSIKFFVSQTGSLTKHAQVGSFDLDVNKRVAEIIHRAGFLFKEHNADYLVSEEVKLRKLAGVDAINIAPQLGAIQSKILLEFRADLGNSFTNFYNYTLSQGYWKKWVTDNVIDDDTRFIVSAHYCYNSSYGKTLFEEINAKSLPFYSNLQSQVFKELDEYRLGYHL